MGHFDSLFLGDLITVSLLVDATEFFEAFGGYPVAARWHTGIMRRRRGLTASSPACENSPACKSRNSAESPRHHHVSLHMKND